MSDTIYLPILLAARRTIKRLAAQEDVPPGLKTELDVLLQSIKFAVNAVYPPNPGNPRFQLVDQAALLRQHEAIVKTARDALSRVLPLLDFRPIKSEADCLMDTVAANVDNEKLSDADFREFIRNSIRT